LTSNSADDGMTIFLAGGAKKRSVANMFSLDTPCGLSKEIRTLLRLVSASSNWLMISTRPATGARILTVRAGSASTVPVTTRLRLISFCCTAAVTMRER
jgi:hypothetical protein